MTLFAHKCWYCGHKSRNLDIIQYGYPGGPQSPYQCRDWRNCEIRRKLQSIRRRV